MKFKVRKMEDTPYKRLPIELQVTILLKLPVKSLVRFKCVSKNWLTEITSQSFIDLYNHENYSQNHDSNHRRLILVGSSSISSFDYSSGRDIVSNYPFPLKCRKKLNCRIVGSCNGLLCFMRTKHAAARSRKICVYNPITRANRVIPISAFPGTYMEYETGFGYDYKILWVFRKKLAYIFRLKNNTCEEIKYTPTTPFSWHFGSFYKEKSSMVYSNNALHWVGPETRGAPAGSIVYEIISCFDIGSEQFYELKTPRLLIHNFMYWNIADLKGYLHLVTHCFPGSLSPSLEIWIMKEYGVQNSWTKLINYSSAELMSYRQTNYAWSLPNVYVYSKDDQEILIKFMPYPKELFSCNLITREIKKVGVSLFDGVHLFDSEPEGFYVAPWSPSFVSPL